MKLSGFSTIITTASLHNSELLKSLGATHVIDRKADVVSEAKKILGGPIDIIYDAVSSKETQIQALDIVAPGGQVISVLGVLVDQANYPDKHITVMHADVHSPNVRSLAVSLYSKVTELLMASGALKVRLYIFCALRNKTNSVRCSDESRGVVTERTCGYSRRPEEDGEGRGKWCEACCQALRDAMMNY